LYASGVKPEARWEEFLMLEPMPDKLNRRQWIGAALGATAIAASGCGRGNGGGRNGRELKVFNWSDYIHPDVIDQFENDNECRVIYDNYSSDAELETRLATGGGAYDVVFPSDRAMPALRDKDLLREIDPSRLPNARHLDAKFLQTPFDSENQFSLPYFWGTVAVGVRADHEKGTVTGFEALFDGVAYAGRITMLDDMENVVAAVLAYLGLPINSVAKADLDLVRPLLLAQRPLVQAYTSDSYKERLISGDAWVSLGWSGDLMQAADAAAEVRVVVPADGTMIWLDSMAIPRAASEVELAHQFINYLLEPEVAVQNAQHVHYATPNRTALALLPPAMRQDKRVYPPQATLDRCAYLENRGDQIVPVEALWREVRQ
jgi:spermidine/putrescine transport system substrate-binding protein